VAYFDRAIEARQREEAKEDRDSKVAFLITLVTGPRRSLSLKLSDTRVYEP